MKICIYGAGAIGGYLGVQLARAGADVSLVARGAHLAAMRENGLKLLIGDEDRVVQPRCTDNPAELGAQDFVIICLKAHSIPGVIDAMQPLLGPRTRIVTAVKGIPYWYFYRHGGATRIDAGKHRSRRAAVARARSGARHRMHRLSRHRDRSPRCHPHVYGNRFPIGEPSGEITADVQRLSRSVSPPPVCRRPCSIASATKSG